MKRHLLKFHLSSYWHVGSGAGGDAVADAVVQRDAHGLPTIPGRTIKGLLRDAMSLASLSGRVAPERVEKWFGSALPGQDGSSGDEHEVRLEEARFSTEEGALWFGSARLPESWRNWAGSLEEPRSEPAIRALYTHLASTALDQEGVARDHTLRVVEVTVPMELEAEVHGPDDAAWAADLRACLPILRSLGSRRNRGFGRVDVRLEEAR